MGIHSSIDKVAIVCQLENNVLEVIELVLSLFNHEIVISQVF